MESDWPRRNKSRYVTEIVSWLGFADVIFGEDKRQSEISLRSQASVYTKKIKVTSGIFLGIQLTRERCITILNHAIENVACERRRISSCRLSLPKIMSVNPSQETISVMK